MISIIVPVYNEEECLLKQACYYPALSELGEVIFVDGGSTDKTVGLAEKLGRLIHAPKNRARQMNRGAQEAQHPILLFLHADAVIDLEDFKQLETMIKNKDYIGGCFKQELDDPSLLYRWMAWTGNLRAKLSKIFYGDQAIFVRKDVFEQLGGFPDVKIGEDVLFTKKLRKKGRVGMLPLSVYCSARRWRSQGIWRTFWLNWRINVALTCNHNLDPLAYAYKDIRGKF